MGLKGRKLRNILIAGILVFLIVGCSSKKEKIKNLASQGDSAIPKIAKYLKDPDLEVRKTALKTLKNMESGKAIPYIQSYINSAQKKKERRWGIKALNYINEHSEKDLAKEEKPDLLPIDKDAPLEKQINNFVHNFRIKGNRKSFKGEELLIDVEGSKVINWTDITTYYHKTKEDIKDWSKFLEYIKRAALGYPTGDMTKSIFKKFPEIKVFQTNVFVGKNPVEKGDTTRYKDKWIVGRAAITRDKFKQIDEVDKQYLDKLSVSQTHFDKFKKEARKFLHNIYFEPGIVSKAKSEKSEGTEIEKAEKE